jgi:thiamine biosynthesis protein ThiI
MNYQIRYSPEMTTKSRIVRTRFCKQLRKNLAKLLRLHLGLVDKAHSASHEDAITVQATWDFLLLVLPPVHEHLIPQVENILGNIPGIWSYNRIKTYPLTDLDGVVALAKATYSERLQDKSFVVRCRRTGSHPFRSTDVERYVGAGLLQQTGAKGVSLRHPEVTVAIEIRQDELLIIEDSKQGLGGFPIGTQDGVISLLSGGFDSAVTSYLAMKRGLRTNFLFFNLGGREHEIAVKEVAWYLWMRFGASHPVTFITVPFEGVVAEILEKVENSQMGVILKRMMLRAATKIADEFEIDALVTGESVAQVSSQTLINLAVIDEVTPKLVLRPLCMSDKQDIVDLARKIGTAEFSAVIPEYCGVISVKPTTRAKRHRIAREELRFDMAILEQALADKVVLDIRKMAAADTAERLHVPIVSTPRSEAVIIDIRHPDEEERRPLRISAGEIVRIPFYKLNNAFAGMAKDREYLLYCDKGVMSQLHASHLLEQGYSNIGVYRPQVAKKAEIPDVSDN